MGSTGWSYYTPYKEDIAQALQDLRQREFEGGHHQQFWLFEEVPEEVFEELDELEPEDWDQSPQKLLEAFVRVLERKHIHAELPSAPQTIDELLERNGPDGTHSILDIDHIASQPEDGAAVPLPEAKLLEWFGTNRPTRALVEKVSADDFLEVFLDRWQAIFIIIYQDGYPSEIYFTGHSGG
jgi:hypothetical protein